MRKENTVILQMYNRVFYVFFGPGRLKSVNYALRNALWEISLIFT